MDIIRRLLIIIILALVNISAGALTVVLDAGHGGRDPGCKGKSAVEKDITLSVAKMLRDMIEKEYGKDVDVVMTRDNDRYLSLQERADIANSCRADLFISIHINSVDEKNPRRNTVQGTQVYVLSDNKSKNKRSAMIKNIPLTKPGGKNKATPGSRLSEEIGYDIAANGSSKLSQKFAGYAMERMCSTAGRADMGVRQAGFQVLWGTAMPAVLVELDYLCNPDQEKFLASEKGQKKCAQALCEAFGDYYKNHVKPKANKKGKKNKRNKKR